MKYSVSLRDPTLDDVDNILEVLQSNQFDVSLFQQPKRQVRQNLQEFILAEDEEESVIGCAQLHLYEGRSAEILAVAVRPQHQGHGIGEGLMRMCIDSARSQGIHLLWLATSKPDYFSRYGFGPFSKWELPADVLLHKLRLVFQQPAARWLSALAGRHTFMRLDWKKYP